MYDHDAFDKVEVLMLLVLTQKTLLFCSPKGGDAEDTGPVLYHRRTLGSRVLRTCQHVPGVGLPCPQFPAGNLHFSDPLCS